MNWGEIAQERLSQIAKVSLEGAGVTRFPFTPEHEEALDHIRTWMHQAGLETHMDHAATCIGRHSGAAGAQTLMIGSHQDSVRCGGRYDGIMGIVIGCLALEKLAHDGVALGFNVEILAFADEEGVRFPTALMGPRALAGTFDPSALEGRDANGVTLGDALQGFGGTPSKLAELQKQKSSCLGYLEIHIEQGPVLEDQDTPLGIVTGICGIERNHVTFEGRTGHAGTVPMQGRKDALVAASELITQVHEEACLHENLRATVGNISVFPNVVNAIPSHVELSLEIRSLEDGAREGFSNRARQWVATLAQKHNLLAKIERRYVQGAVPCDPPMMERLAAATRHISPKAPDIPSGATHDASAMADLCPMAMLFVRCKDGISHHPEEYVTADDMHSAICAVAEFLRNLDDTPPA